MEIPEEEARQVANLIHRHAPAANNRPAEVVAALVAFVEPPDLIGGQLCAWRAEDGALEVMLATKDLVVHVRDDGQATAGVARRLSDLVSVEVSDITDDEWSRWAYRAGRWVLKFRSGEALSIVPQPNRRDEVAKLVRDLL